MRVLTFAEFAAERGFGESFLSEPGMHRGVAGQSERAKTAALRRLAEQQAEHAAARCRLLIEYEAALAAGEVRRPVRREQLAKTASGHPDNASVQAARRLLARLDARP